MGQSSGVLTLGPSSAGAGSKLFFQRWLPEAPPRAVVLLAHGYAEHLGRYEHVAARLNREGIAVFAVDHWGHGRSDGARGFVPRFSAFCDGMTSLLDMAKAEFPDLPRIVIGHSMGGLIATAHLLSHQSDYAGAILSGPALKPGEPPTAATLLIGRLLSRFLPKAGILQLDSAAISRDPDVVAAYRTDPLVHTGKMSARLASEMLDTMAHVQAQAAQISLPLLIVHGSKDTLAAPEGAQEMFARATSADKRFELLDGLYHEVFNEPERETVLDLICAWIDAHTISN